MLAEDVSAVDGILSSWDSVLPETLQRWQVNESELRKTWGAFRDRCGHTGRSFCWSPPYQPYNVLVHESSRQGWVTHVLPTLQRHAGTAVNFCAPWSNGDDCMQAPGRGQGRLALRQQGLSERAQHADLYGGASSTARRRTCKMMRNMHTRRCA